MELHIHMLHNLSEELSLASPKEIKWSQNLALSNMYIVSTADCIISLHHSKADNVAYKNLITTSYRTMHETISKFAMYHTYSKLIISSRHSTIVTYLYYRQCAEPGEGSSRSRRWWQCRQSGGWGRGRQRECWEWRERYRSLDHWTPTAADPDRHSLSSHPDASTCSLHDNSHSITWTYTVS